MRRIACVAVHELPLQLLLHDNPDWSGAAVVVVNADRANGFVLQLNEAARAKGVLPAMRYGQALSLASDLRAGVVSSERIERAQLDLLRLLTTFSPVVEPHQDEPGILWLDGGGLGSLYESASAWAQALHAALEKALWQHTVMVGFGRFTTYAAAVSRPAHSVGVFRTLAQEDGFVQGIALNRLLREPRELERLEQLGIRRLRDLQKLPTPQVRERIGPLAYGLRRLAEGDANAPLQAARERESLHCHVILESIHEDRSSVLFRLRGCLPDLLERAARRSSAVTAMLLKLHFDQGAPMEPIRLQTAAPTLDERVLLDLVRLKLEAKELKAPLRSVELSLEDTPVKPGQESLLAVRPRRSARAANEALARLRTELGPEAVRIMVLRDGHLPEASWGWQELQELGAIQPTKAEPCPPLVRRQRLLPERIAKPDLTELEGPVTLGGGWWNQALERRYYLRTNRRDNLHWIFFDARRGQWYRQARVD